MDHGIVLNYQKYGNNYCIIYMYICLILTAPPTIVYDDKLKSPQSLRGGQKLVIETKIGGIPTPTTGWTFQEQPLTSSPQLLIETTPTSSKLTIIDAKAKQSGVYQLKAENDVGSAVADFTLTIKGTNIFFHLANLKFCH